MPRPHWRDRLTDWRNRLIADPKFQRWAARFPLTKPVARSRAAALFDLCAGFVYSQVLLACVELGLFQRLARGPLTAGELAAICRMDGDAADRLIAAAVSLRLFALRADGRYGLGDLGAALVGNPGLEAMIRHHALVYRDLADPVRLLRREAGETELHRFWAYSGPSATPGSADAQAYSALMAATQSFVQDEVLDAYPFARHRHILDVGGGNGGFLSAVGRKAPDARLQVFDLPPVAELAAARFVATDLAGRASAIGGDFRVDPLPAGADLVTLVRILHDHDDETVRALLASAHRALAPGGWILVAEPLGETPGVARVGDAYFGLYLFAMGRGRPRTAAALSQMMQSAGFADVKNLPTNRPMLTSLLTGQKSEVTV